MRTLLKCLSRRFGRHPQHQPRRTVSPARFRPAVETLEGRDLPSVTIPTLFNTGVSSSGTLLSSSAAAGPQADPHYTLSYQTTLNAATQNLGQPRWSSKTASRCP